MRCSFERQAGHGNGQFLHAQLCFRQKQDSGHCELLLLSSSSVKILYFQHFSYNGGYRRELFLGNYWRLCNRTYQHLFSFLYLECFVEVAVAAPLMRIELTKLKLQGRLLWQVTCSRTNNRGKTLTNRWWLLSKGSCACYHLARSRMLFRCIAFSSTPCNKNFLEEVLAKLPVRFTCSMTHQLSWIVRLISSFDSSRERNWHIDSELDPRRSWTWCATVVEKLWNTAAILCFCTTYKLIWSCSRKWNLDQHFCRNCVGSCITAHDE